MQQQFLVLGSKQYNIVTLTLLTHFWSFFHIIPIFVNYNQSLFIAYPSALTAKVSSVVIYVSSGCFSKEAYLCFQSHRSLSVKNFRRFIAKPSIAVMKQAVMRTTP